MKQGGLFNVLINFLIIIVLFPIGLQVFGDGAAFLLGNDIVAAFPWISLVTGYVPMLLLVFVYLRALLEPWKEFGLCKPKSLVALSVGIGVVSAIVIFIMDMMSGYFTTNPALTDPGIINIIGYLFAWGLLGPFTEELLFRGTFQSILTKKISSNWKIHPAIFIATALEALMHLAAVLFRADVANISGPLLAALPQTGYILVFGMLSGWVFYKTRSLVGPLLIHGIGNAGELLLYWVIA